MVMATPSKHEMKITVAHQRLHYAVFPPSKPPEPTGHPVLLFLHGAGERGNALQKVNIHGPIKHRDQFPLLQTAVIVTPQCPEDQWWNAEALVALVKEVTMSSSVPIDRNRIYVTGLSMGGYATWHLLAYAPQLFAAAIPICGGGHLDSLRIQLNTRHASTFVEEQLKLAKNTPIWAFHGARDLVVPHSESVRLINLLKAHGNTNARLTSYRDTGHDAWSETYSNPRVYDWLFSQRLPQAVLKQPTRPSTRSKQPR